MNSIAASYCRLTTTVIRSFFQPVKLASHLCKREICVQAYKCAIYKCTSLEYVRARIEIKGAL